MKPLTIPRPKGKGVIVLIGGGEFSFGETRQIDEFCLSRMSRNRTMAFLPTASGSAEYGIHLATYFRELAADVTVVTVPLYRSRDARRVKHCVAIAEAGMVYLGGGVTNAIADALRDSPVQTALMDALSEGSVIVGIGAGAAVLGGVVVDHFQPGNAVVGLNMLHSVAVVTGHNPEDDSRLQRLSSLPDVQMGIGIPARTAVVIERDGDAQILGEGSIAIIRRSGG